MKSFQITKTDYLNFRFCRKNLWLAKNRPEEFGQYRLSEFELELVKEGQEVDKEAQNLFPEGLLIKSNSDRAIKETQKGLQDKQTLFQAVLAKEPYLIKADVLKWNDNIEGWELSEVKATTKVKREKFNNHIYDLAFQYNVCLLIGLDVKKINVIHLNPDYQKFGEINYSSLFKKVDVTEEVQKISSEVKEEMELMVNYLQGPEEKFCSCLYRPRNSANHCTTFNYSNPHIPKYAVHDITRINKKKLGMLIDNEILDIKDVPDDFSLSDNQLFQVNVAKKGKPIVDKEEVAEFLKKLIFPLYFIDYESYLPAIPWFDRYYPYQNIVFQYSLHVLEKEDGEIQHFEFLAEKNSEPSQDLVSSMVSNIGPEGSILVWHKPFEMGRNREMMKLNPKYSKFLEDVNERIVDLKEIFSKNMYADPKFKGSFSIKKVLPVLVPELSYENLKINNGAIANKTWGKMLKGEIVGKEKEETRKNLLDYCEQDTLAMVKIYEVLKNLTY